MSLYRTYRPQTFDDVVGQRHIVGTLRSTVEQDKLSHAYLFAGTRGTGKTTLARILAKHMLTRGITDDKIRDLILDGVENGSIVDLTEIDAASNRGIDDIRSLLEKIQFTPAIAGAKVYIIDEVHMLTKEAFNALLKTLEEPPPYAYFILATTELHKIPATIQSRCQRFTFRHISEDDIAGWLRHVADKEKITIDEPSLRAIARHAQGGMRDALSLLDQLRSLPAITLEDVRERAGDTGHAHAEAAMKAMETGDASAMLSLVRTMEESAVPFEAFLRLFMGAVREELHRAIEAKTDRTRWLAAIDTLLQAARDVRIAPVPALVVEAALLSLCGNEHAAKIAPAPAPATAKPAAARPVPPPAATKAIAPSTPMPPAAPAPAPAAAPEHTPQQTLSLESLTSAWPEILKEIDPASVRMSLKNARLAGLEGMTLTLAFGSAFHRDKVAATEGSRAIEEVLIKRFHQPIRLACTLETDSAVHTHDGSNIVDVAAEAANMF